jgi:hypothetical protein
MVNLPAACEPRSRRSRVTRNKRSSRPGHGSRDAQAATLHVRNRGRRRMGGDPYCHVVREPGEVRDICEGLWWVRTRDARNVHRHASLRVEMTCRLPRHFIFAFRSMRSRCAE